MPNSGYLAGDYVINLGDFVDRTYSINGTALRLAAFDMQNNETSTQDVFPNVVQLQAVYGKDTSSPPDNIVDVWNATGPSSPAEWQQIRAIRVAIVARSQNREPDIVTLDGDSAASKCDSTNPHPAAVCWRPDPAGNGVKIDVSSGNADWQHYRYRVVETTVPLRNVIWQQ
jgi:type IV pilus assembly protein PilW